MNNKIIGALNKTQPTIYIGNLRYSRDEESIKKLFTRFGPVSYVKCITDIKTKKSKGFAFVQMKNKDLVDKAVTGLNGRVVDGRTLKVSVAQENEPDAVHYHRREVPKKKIESDTDKAPKRNRRRQRGLDQLFTYLGK